MIIQSNKGFKCETSNNANLNILVSLKSSFFTFYVNLHPHCHYHQLSISNVFRLRHRTIRRPWVFFSCKLFVSDQNIHFKTIATSWLKLGTKYNLWLILPTTAFRQWQNWLVQHFSDVINVRLIKCSVSQYHLKYLKSAMFWITRLSKVCYKMANR